MWTIAVVDAAYLVSTMDTGALIETTVSKMETVQTEGTCQDKRVMEISRTCIEGRGFFMSDDPW